MACFFLVGIEVFFVRELEVVLREVRVSSRSVRTLQKHQKSLSRQVGIRVVQCEVLNWVDNLGELNFCLEK